MNLSVTSGIPDKDQKAEYLVYTLLIQVHDSEIVMSSMVYGFVHDIRKCSKKCFAEEVEHSGFLCLHDSTTVQKLLRISTKRRKRMIFMLNFFSYFSNCHHS